MGVHLFGCSRPAECDVRSGDGCGADETCYVVGGTTSAIEFACAPAVPREAGQPCDDDRCARGLLCDRGICAETCDPTWGSAPLDADGSIPIGDGGALFEPRCDDGTGHCTPVGTLTTRSGTRLGVCRR